MFCELTKHVIVTKLRRSSGTAGQPEVLLPSSGDGCSRLRPDSGSPPLLRGLLLLFGQIALCQGGQPLPTGQQTTLATGGPNSILTYENNNEAIIIEAVVGSGIFG